METNVLQFYCKLDFKNLSSQWCNNIGNNVDVNDDKIDACCQFHQHFTCSFYKRRFQKSKKILTILLNFYAFGICARKSWWNWHLVFNNFRRIYKLRLNHLRKWVRRLCWTKTQSSSRKNPGKKPFRCQFHQHFTRAFFIREQISKLFSNYICLCNFATRISYEKCASKMLMKSNLNI